MVYISTHRERDMLVNYRGLGTDMENRYPCKAKHSYNKHKDKLYISLGVYFVCTCIFVCVHI